ARGEHHRLAADLLRLALVPDPYPMDAFVVGDELEGASAVPDVDAGLSCDLRLRFDQAGTAAHGFQREPAPELELAGDLERLPAPRRGEAHAALSHPLRGRQASLHQDLGEVRVA